MMTYRYEKKIDSCFIYNIYADYNFTISISVISVEQNININIIHSRFSSIPVEKIEYMKIVRRVYRGECFLISIKIKNKILKYKFRLGICGFIRGDNSILLKKLIDDLNKRDIPYEMK